MRTTAPVRFAVIAALTLSMTTAPAQDAPRSQGETTGSVCFSRDTAALSEEAKSAISHLVGIQTMDLHRITVESYGDPGNAAIAGARAESVRNFLSDALEIELSRIRIETKPYAAWPGAWGEKVFTGGMARLPCADSPQTPVPVVVQLSGICKPRNCFRMVCGSDRCWGRRD